MKLSIIIPAYNAQKYLSECIDSVISQKLESKEIIIINDGSTDMTEQICMEYAKKYSYIKYIAGKNEGVSEARNKGIEVSTGDWITFLDADDKFQYGSLDCFEKIDKSSDVILCDFTEIEKKNNTSNDISLVNLSKEKMLGAILNLPHYYKEIQSTSYSINGINNWTCWGKFFNSRLIKNNNIRFTKGITHGEDLIFCYEVYRIAQKITYLPTNLYFYRTNTDSVSRTFNEKRVENTFALFMHLKKDREIVDNIDFQYFIVDRIIACCILYYANRNNEMTFLEKKNSLKHVCESDDVGRAISKCHAQKLSIGKKTNLVYIVLLMLLKIKNYGGAIKFAELIYR